MLDYRKALDEYRLPACRWSAVATTPSSASSAIPPRSSAFRALAMQTTGRLPPEQVLATAQAGLTYSKDPFDIARFEALRAATTAHRQPERAGTGKPSATGSPLIVVIPPQAGCASLHPERCQSPAGAGALRRLWTLPGLVRHWRLAGGGSRGARGGGGDRPRLPRRAPAGAVRQAQTSPSPQLPHAHKVSSVRGDGALLTETDETQGAAYFPIDDLPAFP